jgi:hypothetical protein
VVGHGNDHNQWQAVCWQHVTIRDRKAVIDGNAQDVELNGDFEMRMVEGDNGSEQEQVAFVIC